MTKRSAQPFGWFKRRKKGFGAGFADYLNLAKASKTRIYDHGPTWQEIFQPPPLLPNKGRTLSPWATVSLGLLTIATAFFFGTRLWQLQIAQGQENLTASEGNRIRVRTIPAPRGVIYDRAGYVLAENRPGFRLVADVAGVKEERLNELADFISSIFLISSADAKAKLTSSQNEVILRSGLERERALKLEIELQDYPELRVVEAPIRSYPNGSVLAHLLGYLSEISEDELSDPRYSGISLGSKIGRTGVEASYDFLLRGKDGRELVEVDAVGKTARVIAKEEPIAGRNLVLTIDLNMSKDVWEQLGRQIGVAGSTSGVAVAANPQNGEVLTYLSYPSFDPNRFSQGLTQEEYEGLINDPNKPLFDRVISGSYPPGSTFKPTVATAALSEGVTTKDRLIESPGVVYLGTQAFRNWRPQGLGLQNIVDSIAWSNDIYFYYMGYELGVDRLSAWAKKLGLGEKTGINLSSEAAGTVPTASWKEETFGEIWYPGDNYNYGIGQGFLLVTPLQLTMDVAAIGNWGKLWQPILVKEVRDSSNLVVSRDNPILRRENLAGRGVLQVVKEGMKKACTIFVQFAGDTGCKTGTAEFGGESQNPHGWFTIFAPWENPEIAMTVLIEAGGHGSIVSSPVAKPIFAKYLNK